MKDGGCPMKDTMNTAMPTTDTDSVDSGAVAPMSGDNTVATGTAEVVSGAETSGSVQ